MDAIAHVAAESGVQIYSHCPSQTAVMKCVFHHYPSSSIRRYKAIITIAITGSEITLLVAPPFGGK